LSGSNLTLIDKKLSVEAAQWLAFFVQLLARPTLLGLRDEVQTLRDHDRELGALADELLADAGSATQLALAAQAAKEVTALARAA
jgi:hypothetical protein